MTSPHFIDPFMEARYVGMLVGTIAYNYPNPPHAARLGVARHEASHLVSRFLIGQRIGFATIMPGPDYAGCVQPEPSGTTSPAGRDFVVAPLREIADDLEKVVVFLSVDEGATQETIQYEIGRLQAKAREFVEANWWLIRPLAEELCHRSTLSGEQVCEFLKGEIAARQRRQQMAERFHANH